MQNFEFILISILVVLELFETPLNITIVN